MKHKLYNVILEGYDELDPVDFALGFCWCDAEYEIVDRLPKYHEYKDSVNGVDIYYDYGADYYFFADDVLEAEDLF